MEDPPPERPPVVAAAVVLALLVAGAVAWLVVGRSGGDLGAEDAGVLLDAALEHAAVAADLGEGRFPAVAGTDDGRLDALLEGCAGAPLVTRPPLVFGTGAAGVVLHVRAQDGPAAPVLACLDDPGDDVRIVAVGPFLVAGWDDTAGDTAGAAVFEAAVRRAADVLG